GAFSERGAGGAERLRPRRARRRGAGLVPDARPELRQPPRARCRGAAGFRGPGAARADQFRRAGVPHGAHRLLAGRHGGARGGEVAGHRRRGGRVLLSLRANPPAGQPHFLAHPSRARRVRFGGVARLRGTSGAGPGRPPRAGDARHRRGPGARAVASRDQPRLFAAAAGHLRRPAPHVALEAAALKEGIVLFAHGSREPGWAEPFEKISRELKRRSPGMAVALAYLEVMKPSLDEAVASLAAAGARRVRIVPVFLGVGGHIKDDLPKLAAAARTRHPAVEIVLERTIGERAEVIEAIATAIAKGIATQ